MIDLDAIEARCEKATPGPWEWERKPYRRESLGYVDEGVVRQLKIAGSDYIDGWIIDPLGYEGEDGVGGKEADEDFIAHAREDIPDLLTIVRTQQKRLEELEGIVRELSKSPLRIDDPSFGHMAAVEMDLIDRAKEATR